MLNMNSKTTIATILGLSLFIGGFQATAGGGGFTPGDDLIGTLPAIYLGPDGGVTSGPEGLGGNSGDQAMAPSLMLVGSIQALDAAITDAYGNGYVTVEETSNASIFSFTFHGDVTVVVDRKEIEERGIGTLLRVGYNYLGGVGVTQWAGFQGSPFTIGKYEMVMPYAELLLSGTADAGSIDLILANRGIADSYIGLEAFGNLAQIEQITN